MPPGALLATGDSWSGISRQRKDASKWIDEYGDRDGDGFQEYQTRSPVGYENMGWKDSGDCRRLSGRLAGQRPKGTL